MIGTPDSPDLIDGVRVQPFALWPDDRGYFLEVQRMGRGLAAHFPPETTQVSAALNYPGHHQGVSLSPAPDRLLDAGARACSRWRWSICALGSPTFGAAQHAVRRARCGPGRS